MKTNPCKTCNSPYHTAMYHKRLALQTKTTLKATKPMNKTGKVAKKTAQAVAKWKKTIEPNSRGYYTCYLCGKEVDYLMAEHRESKARRPDLRTEPDNLEPVCAPCNASKGSLSASEFKNNHANNR